MLVRGTRLKMPVDRIDAMITHFKERTVSEAKKLAGNCGAVLLVDRGSGMGWGLTYWEDEAALKASEAAGTSLRVQATEASGATVEEVERLELAVQERAAPARAGTFVRMNDIKGDPARIEEAIRFSRDQALPVVRGLKGFRAYIFAVNRQTGRGIVSTVWETLDDLKASESAVAPLRAEAQKSSGASTVKVEIFESAYADIFQPVTSP
jgi:heme-degrading monooxygenase HmoA